MNHHSANHFSVKVTVKRNLKRSAAAYNLINLFLLKIILYHHVVIMRLIIVMATKKQILDHVTEQVYNQH